jgi:hypothetical protein
MDKAHKVVEGQIRQSIQKEPADLEMINEESCTYKMGSEAWRVGIYYVLFPLAKEPQRY